MFIVPQMFLMGSSDRLMEDKSCSGCICRQGSCCCRADLSTTLKGRAMALAALGQDEVESWFLTRTGIQGSWPTLPLGTANKELVKYTDQMEMTPVD